MKKSIVFGLTFLMLSFFSSAYANQNYDAAKNTIQGWFEAMKSGDSNKAGSYLSSAFTSVHTDGKVRDKAQEINLIKNLHMTAFKLDNFKVSQNGNVLVVTFKDKGVESIDKSTIGAGSALRMAILQKQNDKWLIIAYANLAKV
jgi:hypothetical protein